MYIYIDIAILCNPGSALGRGDRSGSAGLAMHQRRPRRAHGRRGRRRSSPVDRNRDGPVDAIADANASANADEPNADERGRRV